MGIGGRIRGFHGEAAASIEAGPLLRTAFDVDAIAEGDRAFPARWGDGLAPTGARDDVGRRLLLHTDWLDLVRGAPASLPSTCPRSGPPRAEALFRELARRFEPMAKHIAEQILDRWEPAGEQVG
ncbi:hypothetical protein [Streptomyces sp. NBC_01320]|uniref:hypothetical protein n=1 Tax=Streptomyces sp. NBC_01320 TaxID=2903824 RepID=UPI002E0E7A0C|nr:hypothetical protein OG395_12055 [Streptomyces sp. NBC_01320]